MNNNGEGSSMMMEEGNTSSDSEEFDLERKSSSEECDLERNTSSEDYEEMSEFSDEDEGENDSRVNEQFSVQDQGGSLHEESHKNIDSVQTIFALDVKSLTPDDMITMDFLSLEIAYKFYNWYAIKNGFAIRKNRVVKSKAGEVLQQQFVCNKEGKGHGNGLPDENRKQGVRRQRRCGCKAEMRVHVDIYTGRWYVKYFEAAHCHDLAAQPFHDMQAADMSTMDGKELHMNTMRKVGTGSSHHHSTPHPQSGGYSGNDSTPSHLHNTIKRQKRAESDDIFSALEYLRLLRLKDPLIFIQHTQGQRKQIANLFWSDGPSQMSYSLFGDVLALDSTCRRNKYGRPVVVFSGVNHHNNPTVFACAVLSDESEDTYVWVLDQFNQAMNGKAPSAIITDRDIAVTNAINRVFPKCHHRLCTLHLLEHATNIIQNPEFTSGFQKCMLGDYEVGKFEQMWTDLVTRLGLEENYWVNDLYKKKEMWAICHMRGKFFAGFKTTSRCERMLSEIGRHVNTRPTLTEFVQAFQRWLAYMRFQDVDADFDSFHGGQVVVKTSHRKLERSAAKLLTQELVVLFRTVLTKSSLMYVDSIRVTETCTIYTIKKSRMRAIEWYVSVYSDTNEFKCSCMRMESFGLPCDHIVRVLLVLGINELPKCLVLSRWSKGAKDGLHGMDGEHYYFWGSQLIARYVSLVDVYMELSTHVSKNLTDYTKQYDKAKRHLKAIKETIAEEGNNETAAMKTGDGNFGENIVRRRKRKGGGVSSSRKSKRRAKCGLCRVEGHNRLSCPLRDQVAQMVRETFQTKGDEDDDTSSDSVEYSMSS